MAQAAEAGATVCSRTTSTPFSIASSAVRPFPQQNGHAIYGTIPPREGAAAGAARRRWAPRTRAFVLRRRCKAAAPALRLLAR